MDHAVLDIPGPGDEVGPYRLLRPLGEGATSKVFVGTDGEREVAVKLIEHSIDRDADLDQLLREAMVSTFIQHPNVVPCLGCGSTSGYLYLVYELMTGGDGQRLVAEQGPLPESTVLRLMDDTAAGLAPIHHAGYTHGDIKPSNLFLDVDGRGRVGDFGTAHLQQRKHSTGVVGTPAFMAPEQARNEGLDARADIYAVGASAVYWATGELPFCGRTPLETIGLVLTREAPIPSGYRSELSPGFDALVMTCLAKVPRSRYPSAEALREAIAAVRRGEMPPPVELPEPAPPALGAVEPVAERPGQMSQRVIAGLVLLVFISVILAGILSLPLQLVEEVAVEPTVPVAAGATAPAAATGPIAVPWIGPRGAAEERGAVAYRSGGAVLVLDGHSSLVFPQSDLANRLANLPAFGFEVQLRSLDLDQQGPAVVMVLGRSHASCNLLLGQSRDRLELRLRTTATNPDGTRPHLSIPEVFTDQEWHHVLVVREGQAHRCYVDGEERGSVEVPGTTANWHLDSPLVLGAAPRGDFQWTGELRNLVFHRGRVDREASTGLATGSEQED